MFIYFFHSECGTTLFRSLYQIHAVALPFKRGNFRGNLGLVGGNIYSTYALPGPSFITNLIKKLLIMTFN